MSRMLLIPVLMVLLVGVTNLGLATNLPTIDLETAVYFLSPGEEIILVKPGTYVTEATEEWLRLIQQGDERNQGFLLAAQAVTHTESLDAPRTLSFGGEHDIHMVALFLPDGSGLWVTGSYSGIRTRSAKTALQAKRRFLQKKMDALRQKNTDLQRQLENIPMNQSFSLQYLSLQQKMQKSNREFHLLAAIMKTKHETAKAAVGNIR
jgi:ABC-type multidrug transport system fused ATPase/permease subunit